MNIRFCVLKNSLKKLLSSLVFVALSSSPAFAGGVELTTFGHSAILIKGGGKSVLLNPFKAVGCARGLREPRIKANIILASSTLADEGARIAKGTFLSQPGSYRIQGLKLEGLSIPHDRLEGRRYGFATIWTWNQGGLSFAHLGGAAAPLDIEQKVILGRPDVLFIAVGGGPKVYTGEEAAAIVRGLNPKVVIPVQYVTGEQPKGCKQSGIRPFLESLQGIESRNVGKTFNLPAKLPEKMIISIMR